MAEWTTKFAANTSRIDPYLNNRFKIKIGSRYVAGVNKCTALKKTTESVSWFESGDQSAPYKLPGKTTYEPITLSQGITYDRTFDNWANQVNKYSSIADMSLKDFRKNIILEVCNLQGKTIFTYKIYRCWVSEYQAIPELDAAGNAVMIRTIKLEHEGWELDTAVTEQAET